MKNYLLLVILLLFSACTTSFKADENLKGETYDRELKKIAPYVIKKPDEIDYADRFKEENQPFYSKFITLTNAKISYYYQNDTANLFFFEHKDLSSLYEHYRGLGGYYKTNEEGNIIFMNLLYHTPRLTRSEIDERAALLFTEMAEKGNVQRYFGNKKFIDTPNADFYYNTKLNRWDYTENSSWKFLEEAKEMADSATVN